MAVFSPCVYCCAHYHTSQLCGHTNELGSSPSHFLNLSQIFLIVAMRHVKALLQACPLANNTEVGTLFP